MEGKQDQLDDFLRRRLSDVPENPSWNVPDDGIFERAMRAIPVRKRKRRGLWLVIPTGMLAGLMILGYLHYRQVQTLQNKITRLEASMDQPVSEIQSKSTRDHNDFTPTSSDAVTQDQNVTEVHNKKLHTEAVPGSQSATTNSSTSQKKSVGKTGSRGSFTDRADKTNNQTKRELIAQKSIPSTVPVHAESDKRSASVHDVPIINGLPFQMIAYEYEDPAISATTIEPSVMFDQSSPDPGLQTAARSPRYSLMITGNQSWYSMNHVPTDMEARLFDYDNHQPGIGVEGFIEFPFSRRLSAQMTMGCHFFQNRSTLKDQFLFEMAQVSTGQDGQLYYHMDLDLMNPLGDYTPIINFRVSEQMAENEMIEEHIEIRQTLKTMQMNLGLNALLIDARRFDISIGAGAGLACTAWLSNEFDVSLYHEGRLHYNQMELTDHLDNVNKIQLLGYGQVGLTYHVNDQLGLLMQGGYQRGLTSLRNARKSNGTQTYLHALNLSLGITKAF